MKELFRIEDTLANKISYYHIIAFLVWLPFDKFYSELVLISFLLHELIHFRKEKLSRFRWSVMMPALLYLMSIAGAFYTPDKVQMSRDIEKQLALLLFPLIFTITSLHLQKYRAAILKVFALGILATILYLYFDAFSIIRYNKLPISALMTASFTNHNFSLPVNMHATILSMYATVSIAVFIQRFIGRRTLLDRLLYAIGILILMMAILQLSSKAVLIAVLIIFNIVLPFFIQTKSSRLKFITVSVLCTLFVIVGLTKSEQFRIRFIAGLREDLTRNSYNINAVEPRMVRWNSALHLVKQAPIIGHGTGSESSLLKEAYFENKLFISYLNGLNAHNQYISYMINNGIAGLAIFLFVLGFGFKQAITNKDFVCSCFMIVFSVVCLSENILDVNKGIFFFSFFYSFFMRSYVMKSKGSTCEVFKTSQVLNEGNSTNSDL